MSTSSSQTPRDDTALGRAIAKVDDAALRKVLTREVELLKDSRKFGLVFDRHVPESARLPTHPVRAGMTVVRRDDSTDAVRVVVALTPDGVASLDDETQVPVGELVVFRDFGEDVYPGLRSVERISRGGGDAPWHTVINGENLHVLQMLRQTHGGAVDLIYIDPPYNTGNDGWIYNDKYVDSNDRTRSSKWLSFMERRLTVARSLLKQTGVIIVAIGDDEHHRLRMLMDQVFGASNFISSVVWIGSVKNDARYTGGGLDYMLIYARDEDALNESGALWRELKDGLDDVLSAGAAAWEKSDHDAQVASRLLSGWWARNKAKYDPGLGDNVKVDTDGTVIKVSDLRSPNPRPNLQYDVLHPETGLPVRRHPNGWVYSEATMQALIDDGRVLFGESHESGARRKTPLSEMAFQSVRPRFYRDRRAASRYLESVLGGKRFPFPKDHEVLMRWIGIAAPADAVVLDFFGGSGTTTEAVMRLNAEDGGARQSILVTNNEVGAKKAKELRRAGHHPGDDEWEAFGVFEYVTRPRISTVATGVRPDGSAYSEGLDANVDFLQLTYLDPSDVRRGKDFASIDPVLWLDAGARGDRIVEEPNSGWAVSDAYAVLFDIDALKPFVAAVTERALAGDVPARVYVVTDSPTELKLVVERLPSGCTVRRLYESHIDRFALGVDGGEA